MSFATYNDLKLSIIKWSNRSDVDLLIPDFIDLVEKDMLKTTKVHESLQLKEMETNATTSVSTKFFSFPTDYASLRSIRLVLSDNSGKLRFKASSSLVRLPGTGQPNYYTVGSQFEFDITPDQAYDVEFNYYKKPTPLSASNTSNEVLANHPDIYLNGALYFLFVYANDQEKAKMYQGLYSDAIDGANQADEDGRFGTNPYARIEGATP